MIDGVDDLCQPVFDDWPVVCGERNDRHTSPGHVLLIAHCLVSGNEHFDAGIFRNSQQITVL